MIQLIAAAAGDTQALIVEGRRVCNKCGQKNGLWTYIEADALPSVVNCRDCRKKEKDIRDDRKIKTG